MIGVDGGEDELAEPYCIVTYTLPSHIDPDALKSQTRNPRRH